MVIQKVTGKRGRPTRLTLSIVDGKIEIPDGEWKILEATEEEKGLVKDNPKIKV